MVAVVSWYLDGYILQVRLAGCLDRAMVGQVCRDVRYMLTVPLPAAVNVLIDVSALDDINIRLIDLVQMTRRELPRDQIAHIVVYENTSTTLFFLLETMAKTSQLPLRQVKTLKDALHYLRLRDKRLSLLDIEPSEDNKQRSS